ncbi:hypothetical protein [Geobacillus phage TP-84]|uniref:Uncharacterized protein n=1 Tax=Geobacillus phage TP-84 TaxID=1965361 RepID=A0A1U9WQP8_9CAUD|nr:hypothetical protein MUK65_gp81 [Geobacillus phage TP-84]AQY55098.1 hypothetical protein [Geobacillus phage TP-84]
MVQITANFTACMFCLWVAATQKKTSQKQTKGDDLWTARQWTNNQIK